MTVKVESLTSRLALTAGVTVVEVVMTDVAVKVLATLVTVTVCNVTDTGVVIVADVIVTTGVLSPRREEQKPCAELAGYKMSLRAWYTAARGLGEPALVALLYPKLY
jgi:hypothetical protein